MQGGIKAVVWTDTIQVFLMFAGLIAVFLRVSFADTIDPSSGA